MKATTVLSAIAGLVALTMAAPAESANKCEIGATWCDGTKVMTCGPKNRAQLFEQCSSEETCVSPGRSAPHCARKDGAVINSECEVGSTFCDGDQLMTCGEDRTLSIVDDCSARSEICSAPGRSAPHCSLPQPLTETEPEVNDENVCVTPGSIYCINDIVMSCNIDRTTTIIEDCNTASEMCVSPGKSLPHCSATKKWIDPIYNNSEESKRDDGANSESEYVCEPGATFCLDEQVMECGQDRSHNLIEDCNRTEEYCVIMNRSAPHCSKTKIWISFPEAE